MRLLLLIILVTISSPLRAEKSDGGKSPIYTPVGKRDPFKPPPIDKVGRDTATINPLERFSIDKYQLKAILKGMGKPRAMFEDPEGGTFILSSGQYLGRERGTLSRILNKEVIITERTFNYLGQENLYERVLTLPPDEESGQVEVKGGGQGQVRNRGNETAIAPANNPGRFAPARPNANIQPPVNAVAPPMPPPNAFGTQGNATRGNATAGGGANVK